MWKYYVEIPVPPGWYRKPSGELNGTLTFEALGTADMNRAVALMRQIDDSLGIDADV